MKTGLKGSYGKGMIAKGDTLADLGPETLYRPDQDGCERYNYTPCRECPGNDCTYDEAVEAKKRLERRKGY